MNLHRNSQKRYYINNAIYFITTVTKNRYPFFGELIFRDFFIQRLNVFREMKGFNLPAYAVMPDHVHLLIQPGDGFNISEIMFSIKKQFAHDMNRIMGFNEFNDIPTNSNHGTGGSTRSFRDKFITIYGRPHPFPKFQWQESFHDHIIRDRRDLNNHIRYIHRQCEKHDAPGGTICIREII
jgi:REP element-mobilizing transposase RayT